MIHADQIAKALAAYLERHPADAPRLAPLSAALAGTGDVTSRKTFAGHATVSAIVVNGAHEVLHIRHNALKIWLCPGGHLESDDTNLVDAAAREVDEETGIPADRLAIADDIPVDIDVHPIPANDTKREPGHQHYDLRFVFTTTDDAPAVRLQAEEVHDFAWLPLAELQPEHLRDRVTRVLG